MASLKRRKASYPVKKTVKHEVLAWLYKKQTYKCKHTKANTQTPNNESFQNKLEKVPYRACLAITGAIQGISRTKLYDELGLHSLIKRRWCNNLIFFYKIVNGLLPGYLYSCLDFPSQKNYSLRSVSVSVIKPSLSRTKSFKNTFFPYCINEWNNLTAEIRNSKSVSAFKKLIKCKKKKTHYSQSMICLRLQFSHLNEHKFRHGFGDTINAMCAYGGEVETTEHFLLRCHLYSPQRLEVFENLEKVDPSFLNLNVKDKVSFLLYGSQSAFSKSSNHEILKFVINYIKETKLVVLTDLFFVQTNDFLYL